MSKAHVYPENDTYEHELDDVICPCNPRVERNGDLVVHNAWDNREMIEQAEAIFRQADHE